MSRDHNVFVRHCSAILQCWCGIILLVGFLIADGVLVRGILMVVFAGMAQYVGKHIRWFYFLLICCGTIFFQLFSPVGRVLFSVGMFAITETAILLGLEKGITLSGMVFVSVFAVRKDLKIPGTFGGLIVQTLSYFDALSRQRKQIRLKTFANDIDRVLMSVYLSTQSIGTKQVATTVYGWVVVVSTVSLVLLIVLWSKLAQYGILNAE